MLQPHLGLGWLLFSKGIADCQEVHLVGKGPSFQNCMLIGRQNLDGRMKPLSVYMRAKYLYVSVCTQGLSRTWQRSQQKKHGRFCRLQVATHQHEQRR